MRLYSPIVAGLVYFALGGLWFTPLFGKAWDKAVGFDRPPRWRPALPYYRCPLMGYLVVRFAMNALLALSSATTLDDPGSRCWRKVRWRCWGWRQRGFSGLGLASMSASPTSSMSQGQW